ncbi:hypothetical protein B9Z65_8657 [Elsinoe australis]|uniref:Flavoprotein domain-containing protein n=1 Tax=Elsinoe australis TaxID=40998 RepID=A0A2P7YED8_9PEZI|nr:hypothetical protein B9Z65_8657 [Elsinoe australis]
MVMADTPAAVALNGDTIKRKAEDDSSNKKTKLQKTREDFRASDYALDRKPHLLIAATGSVATIKLPRILHALSFHHISIRVLLSASAAKFLQGQADEQPHHNTFLSIPNIDGIYFDEDEWDPAWTRNAPILHIELRRWADAMLIVPLSANTLAKVANGIGDNLVTSVVRAWDTTGRIDVMRDGISDSVRTDTGLKRLWVAPAMNTAMWLHPVTGKHMGVLEEWGETRGGWVKILAPIEKTLACGDIGGGAMMEWSSIVQKIETGLALAKSNPASVDAQLQNKAQALQQIDAAIAANMQHLGEIQRFCKTLHLPTPSIVSEQDQDGLTCSVALVFKENPNAVLPEKLRGRLCEVKQVPYGGPSEQKKARRLVCEAAIKLLRQMAVED